MRDTTSEPPPGTGFSRRHVAAVLAACAVIGVEPSTVFAAESEGTTLFRDVTIFDGFGEHRTGSSSDNACSAWLEGRLAACGFTVETQPFTAATFNPRVCRVEADSWSIDAWPAWPVSPTPKVGIRGVLSSAIDGAVADKIAVVSMPYARVGTWTPAQIAPVMSAIQNEAVAVIVVTEGPTGEVIALNTPPSGFSWPAPVVLIGSEDEQRLKTAIDGSIVTLTSTGDSFPRAQATNVIARRPGVGKAIVVTTPKSGWFHCAGERGSGLAMFLSLAKGLPGRTTKPLLFAATSGHELNELGALALLRQAAPPPIDVGLWLQIGANVAVQNVRTKGVITGDGTAIVARNLFVSADLEETACAAFAGIPGFETPRVIGKGRLPGELEVFYQAGYANLAGLVGSGPLFHTRLDRAAVATTPAILGAVAQGVHNFVRG